MIFTEFKREILFALIWIGLWGLIENIIEKFIPAQARNLRILAFSLLILVAAYGLYYVNGVSNSPTPSVST
jgi:hypothetical protein